MALDFHEIERRHEAAASTEVSARAADAELVRAFQAGDPLAFPAIYERYRPLARHIALRILRSPEEADETSQETMLRVYQGLHRFEGELRLQAWVARIAANLSLDLVRARSRRPARADRPVEEVARSFPDPAQDPHALVARMLEDAEVRRVLATLPPHHRDALVMREFEGRSHAEIGSALGVTPPQAKALLHRARVGFRRAWEAAGQGVAAFVPVLLWPIRRFSDHAAETASTALHGAQAAAAPTLYLVPQVAQTAASSGMSERIAAAGMAVLVAAGVGAGAVAVKDRIVERPAREAAVAAAPAPGQGDTTNGAAATAADADAATAGTADDATAGTAVDGLGATAPAADDGATAADPASAADDAATDPALVVPVGPLVSVTSTAPLAACEGCTIDWSVAPGPGATAPLDGDAHFLYVLVGAVTGADGWSATATVSGDVSGGEGFATLEIAVTSPEGTSTWAGKAYAHLDGVRLLLDRSPLSGPEGSTLTAFDATLFLDPALSELRGALLTVA